MKLHLPKNQLFLLLFLLPFLGFSQNVCQPVTKTFSLVIDSPTGQPNFNDQGFSGIEDSQGGLYCIAGETYGFLSQDVFINKVDAAGNIVDSDMCFLNNANPPSMEGARWMNEVLIPNQNMPAGGYIYTGGINFNGNRDMFIKATDKLGNTAYAQVFDPNNTGSEEGRCVIQDSRGNFVAAGRKTGQFGSTLYAAGLPANFFPNTFVMEYPITGDDEAWAVTEIKEFSDPAGGAVYAITGRSANNVVLLLINSSNGAPFLPQGAIIYDLDNNPETREIGYSITSDNFGNILITGAAERITSTGIQTVPFLLSTSISAIQSGNPGFVNNILYYDIQNSNHEWARHITIDQEQNIILAGKQNTTQTDATNGIESGEAFIMSLDPNGFSANWTNTYNVPGYNGSTAYRVEPVSEGGYLMTGSIWIYGDSADGTVSNYYDKFVVKTDPLGILNNCDCFAPLEVQIFEQYTQPQYAGQAFQETHPEVWYDFQSQFVDVRTDYCDQFCPTGEPTCDDLSLNLLPTTINNSMCCYQLDISNNYGPNIVSLEASLLTPNWVFNSVTINGGLGWVGVPSGTSIQVEHNTGSFPIGNSPGILDFCLANTSPTASAPQQIVFTWYELVGTDIIAICDTIAITDCPPVIVDPPCADIIEPRVDCDEEEGVYEYCFRVQNNSSSPSTQVVLYGQPGYFFRTSPTGPNLTNLVLPLIVPGNGGISNEVCVYVYPTTPVTTPTNVYFNLGVIGTDFCCHPAQEICIPLEPCNDCLETALVDFVCIPDSNKYRLTIDVTNKSNLGSPATGLTIYVKNDPTLGITLPPTGGVFNWSANPLAYNATRTVSTCVDPVPLGAADLILGYSLHHGPFPWPQDSCCVSTICDTFPVPPCDPVCCDDYDAFCQSVDAGFVYTVDQINCAVTLVPNALDSCHQVTIFWGDGTSTGPVPATSGAFTHVYPGTGGYAVCMLVEEIGPDGNICWEKEFCDQFFLDCGNEDVCCPVADQVKICEDFNNITATNTFSSPVNDWSTINASMAPFNTTPVDGTTYLRVKDESGGSYLLNDSPAYSGDWLLKGCELCFDYNFFEANGCADITRNYAFHIYQGSPTSPTAAAVFTLNNVITAGSGWHQICIPIDTCNVGGALPSNSFGTWSTGATTDCNLFNNLITNVTGIRFSVDNSCSFQTEEHGIDNLCFTHCGPVECCVDYIDFCEDVAAGFNYIPNGANCSIAVSPVALDSCQQYIIDWGDGSTTGPISGLPVSTVHNYSGSGNYTICIRIQEIGPDGNVCWTKQVCEQFALDCPQQCCQGTYEDFVNEHLNPGFSYTVNCNDLTVVPNGLDDCHQVTWLWGDGTIDGPFTPTTTGYPHTYPGPGSYTICMFVQEINPLTGEICFEGEYCKTIEILPCECCQGTYQDFLADHVNPGFTYTTNCNDITLVPNGQLDECHQVTWLWGDGVVDGPFPAAAGTAFSHTYPGSGAYTICMYIQEIDPATGQVCFEAEYCETIEILPCECCSDYEAFCADIDAGFIYTIDQNTCRVSFSPISANDCYRIYWIWGDGTSTSPAPSPADTAYPHDFPGTGSYTVCMIFEVLGPDGTVCWTKEYCRTIQVHCFADCIDDDVITGDVGTSVYQTANTIDSDGIIYQGDNVSYFSNTITLNPGFEVRLGAEFLADIAPCTPIVGIQGSEAIQFDFQSTDDDGVNFEVTTETAQEVLIEVYDIHAKLVYSKTVDLGHGSQILGLPLGLDTGLYRLHVSAGGENVFSKSFVRTSTEQIVQACFEMPFC